MHAVIARLRLHPQERKLIVRGAIATSIAYLALRFFPGRFTWRMVQRFEGVSKTRAFVISPDMQHLRRAIRICQKCLLVPENCLVSALAGYLVLAWSGYASELCIGVRKDAAGHPMAHAWLCYESNIVIGDLPDITEFQVLYQHKQ